MKVTNKPISIGERTFYIHETRVHPNPTETIFTVWEPFDGHHTVTFDDEGQMG